MFPAEQRAGRKMRQSGTIDQTDAVVAPGRRKRRDAMDSSNDRRDIRELNVRETEAVAGAGIWEAFLCFLQGGTDASHTQTRREGGGPRGA